MGWVLITLWTLTSAIWRPSPALLPPVTRPPKLFLPLTSRPPANKRKKSFSVQTQRRSKGERLRTEDFYGAESTRNQYIRSNSEMSMLMKVNAGDGFSPAHKQDLLEGGSSSSHLHIPAYAWCLAERQKKHGREGCRRSPSIGTSSPTQKPHFALWCQAQDNLVTIPWKCPNVTFITPNQRMLALWENSADYDWTFESTDYYLTKRSHCRYTNSSTLGDGTVTWRILRPSSRHSEESGLLWIQEQCCKIVTLLCFCLWDYPTD